MRLLPAFLAFSLAVLIFLVIVLFTAWGWNRGYSVDALYAQSLITLAGFGIPVLSSLAMLVATWRGARVWVWVIGLVLLSAVVLFGIGLWRLIVDPGDAFWVVPPLWGFAGCSVWSVWIMTRRNTG